MVNTRSRLARAARNPRVLGPGLVREAASLLQRGQLAFDEARAVRSRPGQRPARVFSLDVHQSVIADLAVGMPQAGLDVLRWSISSHNHVNRRVQIAPDPVSVVNAYTWKSIDENMIDAFQDRYSRFLQSFDGFVVCYPFAFAELFRELDRPLLAVSATRYEVPYTLDPKQWNRLNAYLVDLDSKGALTLAANNVADRDYVEYFTGLKPSLTPSVCDYLEVSWSSITSRKVVFSRIPELERALVEEPQSTWLSSRAAFGGRYSWSQLATSAEVFVIPYNISTMTLFELATAGVPVTVPSKRLFAEWIDSGIDVLSELSFYQVLKADSSALASDNPNNLTRHDFYDWWLARADFYDRNLMPNVRTVDSFAEAVLEPHPASLVSASRRSKLVYERNRDLRARRTQLLEGFSKSL